METGPIFSSFLNRLFIIANLKPFVSNQMDYFK